MKRAGLAIVGIICCLLLAGCPAVIDTRSVASGDFYRNELTASMEGWYGVRFEANPPEVCITYDALDGTEKTVVIALDGFDADKLIGYKLVTAEDKSKWDQQRSQGVKEVPDVKDIKLLQKACADYADFPIILVGCYAFQGDMKQSEVLEQLSLFRGELDAALDAPSVKEWSKNGLYDGAWIRAAIEESYRDGMYQIHFTDQYTPKVSIIYGTGSTAAFELDGYDAEKKVGYKFVTEADEAKWTAERQEGNVTAPDMTQYHLIQAGALSYDFPVVFYYCPDYDEKRINEVIRDPNNNVLPKLKDWLHIK